LHLNFFSYHFPTFARKTKINSIKMTNMTWVNKLHKYLYIYTELFKSMCNIHIIFKQNLESIKNCNFHILLSLIWTPLDTGVIYICVYNIILLDTRLMYNSCYVNRVGLRVVDGGDGCSTNLPPPDIIYSMASIYDDFLYA